MFKKMTISIVSAASIFVIAATGIASARGGRGGGDHHLALLAHAAGVSGSQIHSAFKSDPNLKTDFTNLRTTKDAMTTCLVSGASCSSQISAYTAAQQALTQEKMSVWQKIFQSAPNPKQASAVLGQLNQLKAQRHQIMQSVFKSASASDSSKTVDE